MPSALRRTFADEQQVVSTAVIGVMHALMVIAQDSDIEVERRIEAAAQVLAYAIETAAPEESEGECVDGDESSEEG